VEIRTIGFTQWSAEGFFEALKASGVRRIVDTRLNNTSQLAAFAKRNDLAYFARTIANVEYTEAKELAPTADLLDSYKKRALDWDAYAAAYLDLINTRDVAKALDRRTFDGAVLLCSEHEPRHCHRRLAAEYLAEHWGDVTVTHLSR